MSAGVETPSPRTTTGSAGTVEDGLCHNATATVIPMTPIVAIEPHSHLRRMALIDAISTSAGLAQIRLNDRPVEIVGLAVPRCFSKWSSRYEMVNEGIFSGISDTTPFTKDTMV